MKDDRAEFEKNIVTISHLSSRHSLYLNPKMYVVLLSGTKHLPGTVLTSKLKINGEQIRVFQKSKDLGLIVDYLLRFIDYIVHCVRKLYSALKLLYLHQNYLSIKI